MEIFDTYWKKTKKTKQKQQQQQQKKQQQKNKNKKKNKTWRLNKNVSQDFEIQTKQTDREKTRLQDSSKAKLDSLKTQTRLWNPDMRIFLDSGWEFKASFASPIANHRYYGCCCYILDPSPETKVKQKGRQHTNKSPQAGSVQENQGYNMPTSSLGMSVNQGMPTHTSFAGPPNTGFPGQAVSMYSNMTAPPNVMINNQSQQVGWLL